METVVTVTLRGRVWGRGYTRGVALLEGGGRGRRGGSGGGRITAGIQLIQRRRLILAETVRMKNCVISLKRNVTNFAYVKKCNS